MAFNVELSGLNVPEPPDQIPPVAIVTEPFNNAVGAEAQTVWLIPAFAVGDVVIVTTIASETAVHVPFPVVVSVRVTAPAVLSAALGV